MCTLRNAIFAKSIESNVNKNLLANNGTEQAVNTIKQAAEASKAQTLFFKIKDLDLITKEFKYHECCYKDFTRKEKHLTPSLYGKGNFEKAKACIEKSSH